MNKSRFLFENLDVYKESIDLSEIITKEIVMSNNCPNKALINQLQRAVLSIPINIAEESGRYHVMDKRRFYYIARGSLHEVVTTLQLLTRLNSIPEALYQDLYSKTIGIGKMLSGLIRSTEKGKKLEGDR